jgi:hypothetical protein
VPVERLAAHIRYGLPVGGKDSDRAAERVESRDTLRLLGYKRLDATVCHTRRLDNVQLC